MENLSLSLYWNIKNGEINPHELKIKKEKLFVL